MKSIFFFLLCFCFISSHGQTHFRENNSGKLNFTKKENRDTIIPAGRNEIYLNIAPVFTTLFSAPPQNEAYFSLFFKRTLKNPRLALRTGFVFRPQTESFITFRYPDLYINQSDSTRIVTQLRADNINKFQLNGGMEYRYNGNHKWTTFLALDLLAGYYKRNYSLVNIHQTEDTSGNWQTDLHSDELIDYRTTNNFYLGLTPKFGVRYAFNSHWMMSLQTGCEFVYNMSDFYYRSGGTTIGRIPDEYLEFNMNGLLEEFCIVYRF